jgi:hypothetical protein
MNERELLRSDSPRVHAVILTSDRTQQLGRCAETALSTMGQNDVLTVLDDSAHESAQQNLAVLSAMARNSTTTVSHVTTGRAHAAVAGSVGETRLAWQEKNAPRDIAPLRNVAMLLAVAASARTTVFIDDDVAGFDLAGTHEILEREPGGAGGVIVGAEIGGWTEMDTVTRLDEAMQRSAATEYPKSCDAVSLFRVDCRPDGRACVERRWVSAGYMAFRIPAPRLLAFPPGYNEDWLWCLLQRAEAGTRVVGSGVSVLHEPPTPRRPTEEDVRFELVGDLVFDSFLECMDSVTNIGTGALVHLGRHTPSRSLLPVTRIRETLEMAAEAGPFRLGLEEHGLRVLRGMQENGVMDMGGAGIVSAWCREAENKRRAFGRTLASDEALASLRRVIHTGSL